jgi:hypothetical protein
MIRPIHIRRGLFAAVIATALALTTTAEGAGATTAVPRHICAYDWQEGTWHIKQLVKCAARRWDSPGGPLRAVAVARCESHLRPDAYNANGYGGLFQQATRYWPDRAERWGQPHRSIFNARANIIVSIRMAAAAGSWQAWAGCG